jgi:hypothetical protein
MIMMSNLKAFVLAIGLVACAGAANAACTATVTVPAAVSIGAYDPFSASDTDQVFTVSRVMSEDCATGTTWQIGVIDSQTPSGLKLGGSSHALDYNLLFGSVSILSDGAVSGTWANSGTTTSQAISGIMLRIRRGQIVPLGTYSVVLPGISDNGLSSKFFDGDTEVATVNKPIAFEVTVLSSLNLAIAGCDTASETASSTGTAALLGQSCTLNLGSSTTGMATGETRAARINARSNVNYKISMTSDNKGKMTLNGNTTTEARHQVAYQATLTPPGGVAKMFDCAGTTSCGSLDSLGMSTTTLGTDLAFEIKVTDTSLSTKRAGTYKDTITLTILAM